MTKDVKLMDLDELQDVVLDKQGLFTEAEYREIKDRVKELDNARR